VSKSISFPVVAFLIQLAFSITFSICDAGKEKLIAKFISGDENKLTIASILLSLSTIFI
jgi:hypothetical protein